MGKDNRTIDSVGNEALVTAALDALKVDIIDGAGVTLEDLEITLDAIETLLEGTGKVKVWDGTRELFIPNQGDTAGVRGGIVVYGVRAQATSVLDMLPVAYHGDALDYKGERVIPVTPMTGGREEGTFTRGFIPETPFTEVTNASNIGNIAWTTLKSTTVAADTTLWITGISVSDATPSSGIEFLCRLDIDGAVQIKMRVPSGDSLKIIFNTPYKVPTAIVARVRVFQWSGATVSFEGNLHGFYTVDSELD